MIVARSLALVAALLAPWAVTAQDAPVATAAPAGPTLRMDFPETEAIPGQPLSLRLTVLVPTFMPEPPIWPTLEAPNLLVRLPERSTNPTSERVEGDTWSGLTRHYRISPMVPGAFSIPPQDITVTWSDPGTGTGTAGQVTLTTAPIDFSGVLPEGADGLDPFVGAAGLEVTQEITGHPAAMTPGDSLTRIVTARVEGVSPMFLPPLLAPGVVPGLAAYPDDPVLSENEERGRISGTRTESITYVAEGGGRGTLPPVSLDWFDTGAQAVRTAETDGIEVRIDGPPAASAEPQDRSLLALIAGAMAVVLAALALVAHRARPVLRRVLDQRRAAYLASEACAWAALRRAVAARDDAALRPALDAWAQRTDGAAPHRDPRVSAALLALGAARHAPPAEAAGQAPQAAWSDLGKALSAVRTAARPQRNAQPLPPLNPGQSPRV